MGKITGASGKPELVQMQPGLGAPVPTRDNAVPGSAATITLPHAAKKNLAAYFTVVTRAESDNPLAEARRRLAAAEKKATPHFWPATKRNTRPSTPAGSAAGSSPATSMT